MSTTAMDAEALLALLEEIGTGPCGRGVSQWVINAIYQDAGEWEVVLRDKIARPRRLVSGRGPTRLDALHDAIAAMKEGA